MHKKFMWFLGTGLLLGTIAFGSGAESLPGLNESTQTLQERLDRIQEKIASLKAYNSLRLNAEFESSIDIENVSNVDIREGTFVILSGKTLFQSSGYSAKSLEACRNKKTARNGEVQTRVVKTPDHQYVQSGDGDASDVDAYTQVNNLFSSEVMFVFSDFEKSLKALNENKNLSSILPSDFKKEDGTVVDRYELHIPRSDNTVETISYFDFMKNSDNPFPIYRANGTYIKETSKSCLNWTLSIKTDDKSPLGYSEFEYTSYKVPPSVQKTLDKKEFINNPNAYLQKVHYLHVNITSTPEVNIQIFPEEFNFFIPKGNALVIHDGTPGSKPQRIVAEEDRVFTP